MSIDHAPSTEPASADVELTPYHGARRHHQGDEPARPLGPKAAALHARRQRIASARAAARQRRLACGSTVLWSDDGTLAYALKVSPCGVYVERTQCRPLQAQVVLSMVFESLDAFVRWCECDPTRFDHPVLYSQLRRQGDEAFNIKR